MTRATEMGEEARGDAWREKGTAGGGRGSQAGRGGAVERGRSYAGCVAVDTRYAIDASDEHNRNNASTKIRLTKKQLRNPTLHVH